MPCCNSRRSMPGEATASINGNSWDDPQTGQARDLSGSRGHSSTDCFGCPAMLPGPTKTVTSRCSMWTSTRRLFFNSPQGAQAETADRAAIFATRPLSRQPDFKFYLADGSSLTIEPKCPALAAQEFSIFVNAGKALLGMRLGGRQTRDRQCSVATTNTIATSDLRTAATACWMDVVCILGSTS